MISMGDSIIIDGNVLSDKSHPTLRGYMGKTDNGVGRIVGMSGCRAMGWSDVWSTYGHSDHHLDDVSHTTHTSRAAWVINMNAASNRRTIGLQQPAMGRLRTTGIMNKQHSPMFTNRRTTTCREEQIDSNRNKHEIDSNRNKSIVIGRNLKREYESKEEIDRI